MSGSHIDFTIGIGRHTLDPILNNNLKINYYPHTYITHVTHCTLFPFSLFTSHWIMLCTVAPIMYHNNNTHTHTHTHPTRTASSRLTSRNIRFCSSAGRSSGIVIIATVSSSRLEKT